MNQNYDEGLFYVAPPEPPPSRRPPLGSVGFIGWLRKNLFDGALNSIMTIVTFIFVFLFLREFILWAIQEADWGVINNNISLYNVGRFPRDELWRVELLAILMMFLGGLGLAIWGSAGRNFFLTVFVVVVMLILIPIASQQIAPAPIYFLVDEDTVYGPMRFVADEGDELSFTVLPMNKNSYATEEGDPIRGFVESTPGSRSSRLRWTEIQRSVNDALVARAEAEEGSEIEPTVFEQYNLLLHVQLLNAEGFVLAETYSAPNDPEVTLEYTVKNTGWYILQVTPLEVEAVTVGVGGINLPRTPYRELPPSGVAFIRMEGVDIFTTTESDVEERTAKYGTIPTLENCYNSDPIACQVAERALTFEGKRTVGEYLRTQLSPYIQAIGGPVILGILIFLIGYFLGFFPTRIENKIYLRSMNLIATIGWLGLMPFGWILLSGIGETGQTPYPGFELEPIPTNLWQGLLLTLVLTFISVTLSLPLGILLALGRRSGLPVIGTLSVLFIETIRGAPLITILFFAKNVLPFFAESLNDLEQVLRMLVGLTLFSAAYQAEIVRGGLQIIPKGQTEAANALGLNPIYTTIFIILPQALRAVIPASMSQFVSLFKDTSLVQIVGLFELVGITEQIFTGQRRYALSVREAYLYIGIIYFVIAFIMSAISRRLEESGSGAARR
ncbi:MAG: hypothetical protein CUN55_10505 [Phototrophicales bacterium]|nr:MAG: hypothetical protein CUN55_10505 [Phototrophicales bacterium]